MSICTFRSSSKSSKKKSKKLLNILAKPNQQTIKISEPVEDIHSEDINDNNPNEFGDSEDEDEDEDENMTATTIGMSLFVQNIL